MKKWVITGAIILACSSVVGIVVSKNRPPSRAHACEFSENVRMQAGSLKLYCVDEQQLPAGLTGSSGSASYGKGAVVYALRDGTKTVSISLQKMPSKNELANFVQNLIPLHLEVETSVGKAYFGVNNNKTLVSLPVRNSPTWILMTAPEEYSPERVIAIVKNIVPD